MPTKYRKSSLLVTINGILKITNAKMYENNLR